LPDSTLAKFIQQSGTNLLAETDKGAFLSYNNGASWSALAIQGQTGSSIHPFGIPTPFTAIGTDLFIGSDSAGVFRSHDNGASWTNVSQGLPEKSNIQSLATSDTALFAAVWLRDDIGFLAGRGVYVSTDRGANWSAINAGLPEYPDVTSLAVSGDNLFAGTISGVWRLPLTDATVLKGRPHSQAVSLHPFSIQKDGSFYTIQMANSASLRIYNMRGALVFSHKCMEPAGMHSVKIAKLPKGIYVVKFAGDNFCVGQKLIVGN
jgi:hypothetical protein